MLCSDCRNGVDDQRLCKFPVRFYDCECVIIDIEIVTWLAPDVEKLDLVSFALDNIDDS